MSLERPRGPSYLFCRDSSNVKKDGEHKKATWSVVQEKPSSQVPPCFSFCDGLILVRATG